MTPRRKSEIEATARRQTLEVDRLRRELHLAETNYQRALHRLNCLFKLLEEPS